MPKSLHHFACCWNLAIAPSSLKSPLPFSIFYFPFQFSLLGVWTSFQFHSYQLSSLQQLVSRVLIFLIRIYTIVCRESVPFTYNIYGPPFFSPTISVIYLKVPPNVGVQKSTGDSFVNGNVLETGTRHSPRLLRSCLGPSAGSLDFSGFC